MKHVKLNITLTQDIYVNNGRVKPNMIYIEPGLRKYPYINPKPIMLCKKYLKFDGDKITIKIDDIIRDGILVSCRRAFDYLYTFTEITNLDQLDTRYVTDMSGMFRRCTQLRYINASNWDTSNVTNMCELFYGCTSIKHLDVSRWNTSKVTVMDRAFACCCELKELDVSNWDTSNVTDMSCMFHDCRVLESIDITKWNTSNVLYFSYMFHYCESLKDIDVSRLNTSHRTNVFLEDMFSCCRSLRSLDLYYFRISYDCDIGVDSCNNLEIIYVDGEDQTTIDMICKNSKKFRYLPDVHYFLRIM